MSDKSEEPTPKRLRKAQEEGDSPISSFASQSVAFLCALAVVPAALSAMTATAIGDIRSALAAAAAPSPTIAFDAIRLATSIVTLSAPIIAAAGIASAVTSVVQSGGVVATKKLTPKLERLNPIQGFQGLFSAQRLVAILRAALFGGGVAYFAYAALRGQAVDLVHTAGSLDQTLVVASRIAMDVAKRSAMFGLFLAVLDVVVTRRSWRKKLMMSKDEVKREHKESEGDPHQKAARERAHHEMMSAISIANVKTASVVVVNPVHIACALRYDEEDGDEAPVLVAAGHGDLAQKIQAAARQYGVPVLQDVPLARALVELEVGSPIPEALYEAVAEILREAWERTEDEA